MVDCLLFEFLQFRPPVKGKQSLKAYLALVAFTGTLKEVLSAPLLCSSADTKLELNQIWIIFSFKKCCSLVSIVL